MTISDKAKEIIDEHINMIETRLPDLLSSYYIHGSILFLKKEMIIPIILLS